MPAPRYRSRSYRRVKIHTPGGKTRTHYVRRKNRVPSCAVCGKPLGGFGKYSTAEYSSLSHSKKTVNRPYGGNICPSCLQRIIKASVRSAFS
ncbi:MAG: 50S ribosomal protein L34e [Candidatus Asgardarchaeia archaeon]